MTRSVNEVSWKIGGEAGFGIMASGTIFAKTCLRAGLNVFDYSEYPSVIRGGHNTYQVAVSPAPLQSWRASVNILVALNRHTVEAHLDELTRDGAVIYDVSDPTFRDWHPPAKRRPDIRWYGLPLGEITHQAGGEILMRNVVAIGATFGLLSVDFSFPASVITDMFGNKGTSVVTANTAMLKQGFKLIDPADAATFPWDLNPLRSTSTRQLIAGNEAIALGAIKAGCSFYAGYPMTPATSLLSFLAHYGPPLGMLVRHAEDEIGVINETIGAAYAGVRAMCGTAGGGFSLMTEGVGLAGMAEVGIVIVEAQRGGPSTGLPTWTEQGDLRQVLHASQGDFLKIVLAPGDARECYELTQVAFNLAEQYQTPVILMTDKYLAESHTTVADLSRLTVPIDRGLVLSATQLKDDDSYRRYGGTGTGGVVPRTVPGTPHGLFLANSDEHDAYGLTSEEAAMRLQQMDRRARKAQAVAASLPVPRIAGPRRADLTVISWGSTKGVVEDAMAIGQQRHYPSVNHLHLNVLNPFPSETVTRLLAGAAQTVIVEGNQSGQLAGLIRQHTGIEADHAIRRYDGRPFEADELAQQLHALHT